MADSLRLINERMACDWETIWGEADTQQMKNNEAAEQN